MTEPLRPAAETLVSGHQTDMHSRVPKYPLQLHRAESLTVLLEEYAFFTPAILYLYARFCDAPLLDFIHLSCPDAKFYYVKFPKPLFRGLEALSNGNADWNHVLWAVRREHWEPLSQWLVSLVLTYEDVEQIAGIGEQSVEILDPLICARTALLHPDIPVVRVGVFGLNSNTFQAGIVAASMPLLDLPHLVIQEPSEAMQVFAKALYGGSNPIDARTDLLKQEKQS